MKFLIVFVLMLVTGVLSNKTRGRIFGGYDTFPTDFKYHVRIFIPAFYAPKVVSKCSGSIIHNKWILTAAHCFRGGNRENTTVALGLNSNNEYTKYREAIRVVTHKNYFYSKYRKLNDIALIRILHVKYGKYIHAIQLPSYSASFDGQIVTVAGWGATGNNGSYPTKLQFTTLKVLNNTECKKKFGKKFPKTQFCTLSNTSVTCDGDSGSPAVIGFGPNAVQVGLLAYGSSYCSPNTPDAFTRLSSFLTWIYSRIN